MVGVAASLVWAIGSGSVWNFFAYFAVKVFCFAQEQKPLTAKFAKENRKVREELKLSHYRAILRLAPLEASRVSW